MSAAEKQSVLGGFRFFPRFDDGTLAPLHPVFPESAYQNILEVLRGNVEQAMDRGDVRAVLGYTSVVTGLVGAITAIKNAYETIDSYARVLDATEESLADRLDLESLQAAQSRQQT